ncbi:MAG: TonB-dependent receptor [Halieaceae bacterium]|nr:TonB-dependent receptor [Halieaceae bacterium]MCP5166872.1 TonB-dependent receptor [Pseudomonadales bacterium]MCP5186827.1 TonB-dependent receptor [Pseudomonadales bacterium]
MNRLLPGAVLALAGTSTCLTTLADNMLEEIVVTSTGVEMPLRQVGTSISVIDQEEIERLGFISLYDVLRTQPGVSVTNTGGAGSATSLRIRGEEGYRTLVLLDGIDISDTSGPQVSPRFGQLLSSGVQRVEILRGPQGLMYGGDAGGVVNVTTIAPSDGFGGEVSAEGGRYGAQQLSGNVGGGNDTVDFNLSGADYSNDGFNARSTDTVVRDDDGYDNSTVNARIGYQATQALRFTLVGRDVDGNNRYDDCYTVDTFEPTDRCRDKYEQQAWRLAGDYRAGRFEHQLAYTGNDTDRKFFSDGQTGFRARGTLERIGYLGNFRYSDDLRLVYGAERQQESMDDGSTDASRDQYGYYFEYQGGFSDRLFVTAGTRFDDNDDFGTHTSYRLSSAYLIPLAGGELKLKGTYGTGFRAPSLYEVAYNSGSFAYPPASETTLREEQSKGYDLGLSWGADSGLYLEAVYFDQKIEDEIYFDLANYSGYLQRDGTTDSNGVELSVAWPIVASLSLTANYTFNNTETAAGQSRPYRPEHLANLGLSWRTLADTLVLGAAWRLSQDAEDVDGSQLDDYQLLELSASYQLLPSLQLFGRLENALDEDYQEVPTYNTSGAAGYAGVKYTF